MTRLVRASVLPQWLQKGELVFLFRSGDDVVVRREPARNPETGLVALTGLVEVHGRKMIANGVVRVVGDTGKETENQQIEVDEVSAEAQARALDILNARRYLNAKRLP